MRRVKSKSRSLVQRTLGVHVLLAAAAPSSALAQTELPADPAPVIPAMPAAEAAPSAAEAAPAATGTADAEAEEALMASLAQGADTTEQAVADLEEFKLNIYGFTDFTYTARLNDFAYANPYPTFMIGNVNLYVGAELGGGWRALTEFRLLYVPHGNVPLGAPGAVPVRENTTVADPADYGRPLRWGGVEIERAWLEYTAHPLLTVQVGQWLTPYGIWNVDHGSPVIIGVRRPYVVGQALIPERQTGIQIYGSYLTGRTEIGYNLGLSNGRGPIDAYQDLDKNKAVTGRLFVTNDSDIGAITLGATFYRGAYTDRYSRAVFTPAGEYAAEWISTERYEELGLAADLRWIWQDLTVQGEFILNDHAIDDELRAAAFPVPGAPPGFVPDYRSTGWYAMAAYRLPWLNIMPFFGGESYVTGQEFQPGANALWGGLNIRPIPRVVLKAQYTQSWFTDDTQLYGDDGIKALDLQAAWSF
jgi:hypothetical protein